MESDDPPEADNALKPSRRRAFGAVRAALEVMRDVSDAQGV